MVESYLNNVVARILRERAVLSDQRSLLVGVSGIDSSGKGYVAKQIEARLALHSIGPANIHVDGWLNLPDRRFNARKPAEHFTKMLFTSTNSLTNYCCRCASNARRSATRLSVRCSRSGSNNLLKSSLK